MPPALVKAFSVRILRDGKDELIFSADRNFRRMIKIKVGAEIEGFEFAAAETYGSPSVRLYSLDICGE